MLKLLAVELHAGDVSSSKHKETCQTLLSYLYGQGITEVGGGQTMALFSLQDTAENAAIRTVSKSKVLLITEQVIFPVLLCNLCNGIYVAAACKNCSSMFFLFLQCETFGISLTEGKEKIVTLGEGER